MHDSKQIQQLEDRLAEVQTAADAAAREAHYARSAADDAQGDLDDLRYDLNR